MSLEQRIEAFGGRLMAALNDTAMVLMISIGHRARLFDALDGAGALTPAALAARAELHERYVREWLAAMATSGLLEHDADAGTYALPEAHAALLTRRSPENFAVTAQFVPVLAQVEDDILDCFRRGGGVPYERFARFHEVMAEESDQTVVAALFEHILPLVPGLTGRLAAGIDVADFGCGRGKALMAMAERYPASRFTGYDLSADAIAWATAQARRRDLTNVSFRQRDLTDLDRTATPAAYDFITTFDAVHDQAAPLALLRGIRRCLRDDGVYLMQDIHGSSHVHENREHPVGTFLYTISCFHCMTVSLAQGGEGLGTLWGEQKARELLAQAGFLSVELKKLEHDVMNGYYIVRP